MAEKDYQHFQELIPSYALGSLDTDEEEIVKEHLANCESCKQELVAYEGVVDALAFAAPDAEPPAALKSRLMAQVSQDLTGREATGFAATNSPTDSPWWEKLAKLLQDLTRSPGWRPVFILLMLALIVGNVVQWQQANQVSQNSWRRVRLTGSDNAPDARGIIYISADGQKGTFIVDQMPLLSSDYQYQLWLIKDGQRVSGAVFSVDEDGYRGLEIESDQPLQDFESFGITVEPAGGSPGPTGDRVLGYNLTG